MNYFEILSIEKNYYDKLTEDERKIYRASHTQLIAIASLGNDSVRSFVDVSRLLLELHRLHHRYNEIVDYTIYKSNLDKEQQERFENMYSVNEEAFKMDMSIGSHSAVFYLSCMEECEELYSYLAKVKMARFDWLLDTNDINMLIETLVPLDTY